MSMESLNRTSDVVQTPSQIGDTPVRVNVDVLKQRIIDQKKKDKFKRNIIVSRCLCFYRCFNNSFFLEIIISKSNIYKN
jgi:hypothetical protein